MYIVQFDDTSNEVTWQHFFMEVGGAALTAADCACCSESITESTLHVSRSSSLIVPVRLPVRSHPLYNCSNNPYLGENYILGSFSVSTFHLILLN
jgi:hypothetical protein